NVPRNWKDTFGGRLGMSYFTGASEIFASANGSTAAAPAATVDASIFDSSNVGFTLGLRQRLTKRLFVAASYNYLYYFPVDTTGKSQLATFSPPSRSPSSEGSWSSEIYFFNANMTYAF